MRTWTNRLNLPEPLASAIRNDRYEPLGDISVTRLLKPVQMRELEHQHENEIVEDVSDHIWRLLGQSVHAIIERANTKNHLSEERMMVEIDEVIISGTPDLLDAEGTLSDFKVTSTWSFLLGEKPEWEQQLNVYRWLYFNHSFDIKKLQIIAILRDWVSAKAGEDGYPECQVQVIEIPMWDIHTTDKFVADRIRAFHKYLRARPDELPECSPTERWEKPNSWAVKKEARKRAVRVFDSESQAKTFLEVAGAKHFIEFRPGESTRCERFCQVKQWCNQYAKMKQVPQAA